MRCELEQAGGSACFEIKDGEAVLLSLNGRVRELVLPDELPGGAESLVIAPKAALGAPVLKEVILPDKLKSVGDWAFAHCRELERVCIPACDHGTGVFKGCPKLRELTLSDCGGDMAALLACAAAEDVNYLMKPAGPEDEEWYGLWDSWLMRFLEQSDSDGYSGQVPCGEEDYGSSDVGAYESGRRREKADRCFLRLMHPAHLLPGTGRGIESFLRGRGKKDAFLLLTERYPDEEKKIRLYLDTACVSGEEAAGMLKKIPDHLSLMRSLFIKAAGSTDTLDGLEI
ncbi:MAG: hypothetical protein IKI75_01975 [Lachnospiraceae bacterium]|nr:hypothetical protein [Lachnospiraceae bacterium]